MEERKRILRGEERKEEEDMKERWRPWYLTSIMNAFIKPVAVYNEYTPIKEINVRKKITILQSSFQQYYTVGGHASSFHL